MLPRAPSTSYEFVNTSCTLTTLVSLFKLGPLFILLGPTIPSPLFSIPPLPQASPLFSCWIPRTIVFLFHPCLRFHIRSHFLLSHILPHFHLLTPVGVALSIPPTPKPLAPFPFLLTNLLFICPIICTSGSTYLSPGCWSDTPELDGWTPALPVPAWSLATVVRPYAREVQHRLLHLLPHHLLHHFPQVFYIKSATSFHRIRCHRSRSCPLN